MLLAHNHPPLASCVSLCTAVCEVANHTRFTTCISDINNTSIKL